MMAGKGPADNGQRGDPMEDKHDELLLLRLSAPVAAPRVLAMGVLSWVLFGEVVLIAAQQINRWLG